MRVKDKQKLTLKPVHPKPVRHHGLFGKTFVGQHMMIDEHWTPVSLTEEFKKMTSILKKHAQFSRKEQNVQQRQMLKTYHTLQKQCRDGRSHLQRVKSGDFQKVRNILKDHRYMQRLYPKMPLPLVEENINQKTFVMRKDRDRLESRLQELKKRFNEKLLQKANLENRISYENEFKLAEITHIEQLNKQLQQSKLRLKAIMTINATFKRIKQILCHDETFYEPILRSLDSDIEDQTQFIKHILYLGSPALERFKELSAQYRVLDDKVRKSSRKRMKEFSSYRKMLAKPHFKETKPSRDVYYLVGRYVRETDSMMDLMEHFADIKDVIKKIKIETISSNEKDIYPRIKSQVTNNLKLSSKLEHYMLDHTALEIKQKSASVLQGALVNNLADDELKRLNTIEQLKEAIKHEDEFEEDSLLRLKNRANVFVLLRYFLWNLNDIMTNVGPRQFVRPQYPVDYLQLPLLKYEMLTMKACPPDMFEQELNKLLKQVETKLKNLLKDFKWDLDEKSLNTFKETYCRDLINCGDSDLQSAHGTHYQIDLEPEMDIMEEVRAYKTILNRHQIKLKSARLVEEHLKRDV